MEQHYLNRILHHTVAAVERVYELDKKDHDVCEALCQILSNLLVLMETEGIAHIEAHTSARKLLDKITE